MKVLRVLWRKLTNSKALIEAGPHEKLFFETIYRLVYITGLSYADEGTLYKVYCAFIYIIPSTIIATLQIWHVCSDNVTMEETISVINVILIDLVTGWKLITMISNKKVYRNVAKALDSPYFDTSTNKRRQLLEYWNKTHIRFFRILLFMSNGTLFFWNTFPLFDGEPHNLVIATPEYLKYNTFGYIIVYIVICITFNISAYFVIMSEVIMQAYLVSLICQYVILADCFENIFDDCAKDFKGADRDELIYNQQFIDKYKKRLGSLVEQHLMILNQTLDLKNILSAPLLGQLCGSGMLICFVGYQATATMTVNLGKFLMSLFYLGYNMYALYLICRWCEEITSQSQNIGQAIYSSGWENGMSQVPGVKATIIIVINKANKPLTFVAGGMYQICLSSYTNLVKASYSALNILLRMSKD